MEKRRARAHPQFGTYLKRVRESRGLTQYKLAARISPSAHGTIVRLENRTRNPSMEMVEKLCTALECSPYEEQRLYILAGFVPKKMTYMLLDILDDFEDGLDRAPVRRSNTRTVQPRT